MGKYAMSSPESKEDIAISYVGTVRKFHGLIEMNLAHHGGNFAAGNHITIADFIMASHIGNYLTNPAFPLTAQINAIVSETPLILAYK